MGGDTFARYIRDLLMEYKLNPRDIHVLLNYIPFTAKVNFLYI